MAQTGTGFGVLMEKILLCKLTKRIRVVHITLSRYGFDIENISQLTWKPCTFKCFLIRAPVAITVPLAQLFSAYLPLLNKNKLFVSIFNLALRKGN
jgi:hypothetical protein